MIKAQIDKDGYFTGSFSTIGELDNSVEVERLPDVTGSLHKKRSYRYQDGAWEYDEERYIDLNQSEVDLHLEEQKKEKIRLSKAGLQEYLESHSLISACHNGIEKRYNITTEKQQYLSSVILMAQTAAMNGQEYQPSWNASGEPYTYDWNLEELQQLAGEIEAMVKPLVLRQQCMEVEIKAAQSIEELNIIDITFK